MAAGEYVSVSSSRDTELAMIDKEKVELKHFPKEELEELIKIYRKKGLSEETAKMVAKELTENDAFAAHIDAELKIDPENLTNPWHAAFASALAFLAGASIPLFAIVLPPQEIRIPFAYFSVIGALVITGTVSAKLGSAPLVKAVSRVVIGGIFAMTITYIIGYIFGVNVL